MKQRIISFDIARIVSMLMIVTMHVLTIGGLLSVDKGVNPINYILGEGANGLCLVAVNVFVILSGYFNKGVGVYKKLLFLWGQVFFYSLFFFFIAVIFGIIPFRLCQMFEYCLPLLTTKYWFFNSYVGMCLFVPIIWSGIELMDKERVRAVIIIASFFIVFVRTAIKTDIFISNYGYSSFFFLYLFSIGRYYSKFGCSIVSLKSSNNPWVLMALYFVFSILGVCVSVFDLCGYGSIVSRYTSITTFLASLCLFRFFMIANFKISNRKTILVNKLSELSFAVYLIHMHPILREYLLENSYNKYQNASLGIYALLLLCLPFAIWSVCIIIEYLRRKIIVFLKLPIIVGDFEKMIKKKLKL